ncbi:hypothetical protein C8R43DRAFT_48427 [Mycena crocata]|nr:hypothetical protein C8R43DRAFT_48427 [Mycena crocata]
MDARYPGSSQSCAARKRLAFIESIGRCVGLGVTDDCAVWQNPGWLLVWSKLAGVYCDRRDVPHFGGLEGGTVTSLTMSMETDRRETVSPCARLGAPPTAASGGSSGASVLSIDRDYGSGLDEQHHRATNGAAQRWVSWLAQEWHLAEIPRGLPHAWFIRLVFGEVLATYLRASTFPGLVCWGKARERPSWGARLHRRFVGVLATGDLASGEFACNHALFRRGKFLIQKHTYIMFSGGIVDFDAHLHPFVSPNGRLLKIRLGDD